MRLYFCLLFLTNPFLFASHLKAQVQARPGDTTQLIPCSSEGSERHYCTVDTRHGAHLVKQTSQAPCKENESWGFDEEGIWVDKGCSGEFSLGRATAKPDPGAEPKSLTVLCSSENGHRNVCPADTTNGVSLVRQRGDAECKEGSTWGQEARGIWVDMGCSADFVVGVPGHPAGSSNATVRPQTVSCFSYDGRKNYCDPVSPGSKVQLLRQIGTANCIENSTWGYDRIGLWVDRGCGGEFTVMAPSEAGAPGTAGKSCEKTVGKVVAQELVRRCLQVSSAKPSPCSAHNSCKAMEEEVALGCQSLGANAPAFCGKEE